MKVLVITKSPWLTTNAFGNTLTNFFSGWENIEFYNLYLRSELPQNDICKEYYRISEVDLIKNVFNPKNIGAFFSADEIENRHKNKGLNKMVKSENKMLHFFRSYRSSIFLFAREFIWSVSRWKNKKLNDFLLKEKYDIIFAAGADPIYLQNIIIYSYEKTRAKLVIFFTDDTYFYHSKSILGKIYDTFLRKKLYKLIQNSSILYGASPKLCDEYQTYFNKNFTPLYKGCTFKSETKNLTKNPIRIVYAGNLFYGRDRILIKMIECLKQINLKYTFFELHIYTNSFTSEELKANLSCCFFAKFMGALPYNEITKKLSEADIVLHVESFDYKEIKKTRLSFSTKIIDCMQSGSAILAVGPANIASIEYLREIEGVFTISDLNQLQYLFEKIASQPQIIIESAKKIREYAEKNHSLDLVHTHLKKDFQNLIIRE